MRIKGYLYLVIAQTPVCLVLAAVAFTIITINQTPIVPAAGEAIAKPVTAPSACADVQVFKTSDMGSLYTCIVL